MSSDAHAWTVRDVAESWAVDAPKYQVYGAQLAVQLNALLRKEGVPAVRVTEPRVKDRTEILRKFLRKSYSSYDEITDKVGIRIVLRYVEDVDRVVAALRREFECAVEDKRDDADVNAFSYRSVHVQVRGLADTRSDMECEVQVRTVCEDAWAEMSHAIGYKSDIPMPRDLERGLYALAALFEIADERYSRVAAEMTAETARHAPTSILARIEGTFLTLGGDAFDRELSLDVIEALLPAFGAGSSGARIAEDVLGYAKDNQDWLSPILIDARANERRSVFLLQPEALVAGLLLSRRYPRLADLWGTIVDVEELQHLADDLNYSLE